MSIKNKLSPMLAGLRDPDNMPVLLVMLAGAFLRFYGLDRQSLWDDEMTTHRLLLLPIRQFFEQLPLSDGHPPFYYIQLKAWRLMVGPSLVALRANSALWGSMALYFFYRLLKGNSLSQLAILSGVAIFSFSPFHIAYAQELRPYSLAILWGILGFTLLQNLKKQPDRSGLWWALSLTITAEIFTHYWGLFAAFAQVLTAFFLLGRKLSRVKILKNLILPVGLFILWAPTVVRQASLVQSASFWNPHASAFNLLQVVGAYTSLRFGFASSMFFPWSTWMAPILFGLAWVILFAVGLTRKNGMACLWLACGLGIPHLLSYRIPTIFLWYRYPSLFLPAFIWIIADGLEQLKPRWLAYGSLGAVLVGSCFGLQAYFTTWQKANPKSVMAYVNSLPVENTVVVRPAYFSTLYTYYDAGGRHVYDQHTMWPEERKKLRSGQHVILLAFDVPSDPITDAFRKEFHVESSRYFPGTAHLGITVYCLSPLRQPS